MERLYFDPALALYKAFSIGKNDPSMVFTKDFLNFGRKAVEDAYKQFGNINEYNDEMVRYCLICSHSPATFCCSVFPLFTSETHR